MFENGRAWVSYPAAARSENVALPFFFIRDFRGIRCKKLPVSLHHRQRGIVVRFLGDFRDQFRIRYLV